MTCYKLVYAYLVNRKPKKLETDLILIKTLTEIYKTITKSTQVKLVQDQSQYVGQTETISISTTEAAAETKKTAEKIKKDKVVEAITFQAITENKVTKILVQPSDLLTKEVYVFLTTRSEASIEKLVASKYEHLYEDSDEASLQQFTLVKAVIEYLVHANKEMVPHID